MLLLVSANADAKRRTYLLPQRVLSRDNSRDPGGNVWLKTGEQEYLSDRRLEQRAWHKDFCCTSWPIYPRLHLTWDWGRDDGRQAPSRFRSNWFSGPKARGRHALHSGCMHLRYYRAVVAGEVNKMNKIERCEVLRALGCRTPSPTFLRLQPLFFPSHVSNTCPSTPRKFSSRQLQW